MRFYVDGNRKFSLSVNGSFFGVNIDLIALTPPLIQRLKILYNAPDNQWI